MKIFLTKFVIFILLNVLFYHVMVFAVNGKSFLNSACTPTQKEHFDFVLLGTSHGQVFHDYEIRKTISKKMMNLSTGSAGVVPEKIRLICFFESGKTTNDVIYLLDPWTLYSERWNENNMILEYENIDYSYISMLIKNDVSKTVLFNYFRNRIFDKVLAVINTHIETKRPMEVKPVHEADKVAEAKPIEKTPEEQKRINEALDKQRLEILYDEGLNQTRFIKHSQDVEEIIELAKKEGSQVTFIIPPTLMGKMPGHSQTLELLEKYKHKYGIRYIDATDDMQSQDYYWDREHFESRGVDYFTKHYLSKIVR